MTILPQLNNQPKILNQLLQGLPDRVLNAQPDPGKWSIHQQLAHLGAYQEHFRFRLDKILTSEEPRFGRYVAGKDPAFKTWEQQPSKVNLAKFLQDREKLISFWNGLEEKQKRRAGTHPTYGKMDATAWLQFFLLHEAHHLYAIFRLGRLGR